MKVAWLSLPLAILLGCGGGGSKTSDPVQDPNAPRTVSGTWKTEYLNGSGSAPRSLDLSSYAIRALVPAASGGYTVYPGTGLADGTFSIPSVPPGECFIQFLAANGSTSFHFWTGLSQIHLGFYSQGRADWVPAPAGTILEIEPTAAPGSGTYGEIMVPSLGMLRWAYFNRSSNAWQFYLTGSPLPEVGKDDGYFSVLSQGLVLGTEGTQTIDSILSLPAAGLQSGPTTRVLAAPQRVIPNAYQSFTLDAGAFSSATAEIGTTNEPRDLVFSLKAQPFGASVAPLNGATLFIYQSPATTGVVQQTNLAYANPYPASWGEVVDVRRHFGKAYALPGAANPVRYRFSVGCSYPKNAMPSQAITPLISPVRNLRVNGQAVSTANLSVGMTPLFTWEAPTVGKPTSYYIYITKLSVDPGTGSITPGLIGYFRTTQTRVQVPPGLLTAGDSYFASVTATSQSQYDPSRPNRSGFPWAYADHNTEIFVP